MKDTRFYKCTFDILGGRCGEVEWTLEAEFELSDEEYQQAIDALEEHENRFNGDLPGAMSSAIWDVAWDRYMEDAKEYAEDDEASDDELLDPDGVYDNIYNISEPVLGIKKFYEQSLGVIKTWQGIDLSKPATYNTVPFLEVQKKGKGLLKEKYLDLMPEPFWGDPDNCLAAIINLNPGFGDDDKDYIGKKATSKCHLFSSGFLEFAKANPYFTHAWFHPAATSWWAKRLSWLHKVLECQGSWRLPFMTELCPWHSAKWGEAKIDFSTYKPDYVLNVLDAAAYAANMAGTPIFAIGKAGDIYKNYLGDPVQSWGPEDNKLDTLRKYSKEPLEWPRKKKKGEDDESDINVSFDYYKSELNGREIKLLNIWMLGSNHTPSDAFLPIERVILKYIENN